MLAAQAGILYASPAGNYVPDVIELMQVHGIVPWPLDAGAEIIHGEASDVASLLQHALNTQLTEREYPNYVYWHDKGVIEYAGEQSAVTNPVVKRMYGLLDEVWPLRHPPNQPRRLSRAAHSAVQP